MYPLAALLPPLAIYLMDILYKIIKKIIILSYGILIPFKIIYLLWKIDTNFSISH